jgi:hypothetical protein
MRYWTTGLKAACCAAILAGHAGPGLAAPAPDLPASAAWRLAREVTASSDHGGLPFAVVDKQAATLTVFRGDGREVGTTPALLGRDLGDRAAPGVGARAQNHTLRAGDQVTTAGRFASQPGHNLAGEAVVWIDHGSALAIHRLRPGPLQRDRALRLAMAQPRARRVSAGCVVVPAAFYDSVVAPLLGRSRGVVYVMAEGGAPPQLPADADSH